MAELRTILASLGMSDAAVATGLPGGGVQMTGGVGDGVGAGGTVLLAGGAGGATGQGGVVSLQAGNGTTGNGGAVELVGGTAVDGDGGSITLSPGTASGAGLDGNLILLNLPIADPTVAGALWNDAGTLKISAG